jgi:FkbM family methyltransferase
METAVVAARFCPRLLWRYRYWAWQLKASASEPEVALVSALCSRAFATADIGANAGEYTMHAIPRSQSCIAFEPRPDRARALSETFLDAARIEQVALSDTCGEVELRIPRSCATRSTIEPANALDHDDEVETVRVRRARLDDFAERRYGFLKIDVEGHEEAVLRGSLRVLRRDRPSLLIEIEERHNPGALQRVRSMLSDFGYLGYFLHDGRLRPLAHFDAATLQPRDHIRGSRKVGVYLNNFLFVQPARLRRLSRWLY